MSQPNRVQRLLRFCFSRQLWGGLTGHLRRHFTLGFFLLVPLLFTYLVLRLAFDFLDGFLSEPANYVFGRDVPGVGLVALIAIVYLGGLAASNFVGRRVFRTVQDLLMAVPLVRTIYGIGKNLIDSLSEDSQTGLKRVVVVEYPRPGIWAIGFLTGFSELAEGEPCALVYIPTAPLPNSGWIGAFPLDQVFDTEMNVQAAMQMVLSGGILYPKRIGKRPLQESIVAAKAGSSGQP